MVLVCPVQTQETLVGGRQARELQLLDEFLIKLRYLQQQLNATSIQFRDRMKRIENLNTAAGCYYEVGCVDSLGNIFYQIKCEVKYELEKVQNLIPGHLITLAQEITGDSSEKHKACIEASKKLQRLGDEIVDSKSRPSS